MPVERHPVTVLISEMGWVRTVKGKLEPGAEVRWKEGDRGRFALEGWSTDKLLILTADGKAYGVPVEKLPGGRGTGEPLALFLDLAKGVPIVAARLHRAGGKLVLATRKGLGFVAPEAAILPQTRTGRQVVNLEEGDALVVAAPVEGELVAVSGSNHKLLIFELSELPEQARGKGVRLLRLAGAELVDLVTTTAERGLVWRAGERLRTAEDWAHYKGRRGGAGRLAPRGFPKDHRFGL